MHFRAQKRRPAQSLDRGLGSLADSLGPCKSIPAEFRVTNAHRHRNDNFLPIMADMALTRPPQFSSKKACFRVPLCEFLRLRCARCTGGATLMLMRRETLRNFNKDLSPILARAESEDPKARPSYAIIGDPWKFGWPLEGGLYSLNYKDTRPRAASYSLNYGGIELFKRLFVV